MAQYLTGREVRQLFRRSLKYSFARRPRVQIVTGAPSAEPLVSIIIATYNWSNVLRLAIRSVLWQTEQDFELLVVGDGCTDDSESIVNSFGDARIRWHNLAKNSGSQSAPNNAGLALARGRYVAYLGHDDLWRPDHLRSMLAAMGRRDAGVASSLVEMIGPKGTNYRIVTGIYPAGGYDGVNSLPPSGLMHRREIAEQIGGWPDYRSVWRNPDAEFVYRAWESGIRFVSTGELTVFKFNSAMRKNCYVEKPCHEQAAYLNRIQKSGWFLVKEIFDIAAVHLRRLPMDAPAYASPPQPRTPGWEVSQYRKFRGLD